MTIERNAAAEVVVINNGKNNIRYSKSEVRN